MELEVYSLFEGIWGVANPISKDIIPCTAFFNSRQDAELYAMHATIGVAGPPKDYGGWTNFDR